MPRKGPSVLSNELKGVMGSFGRIVITGRYGRCMLSQHDNTNVVGVMELF